MPASSAKPNSPPDPAINTVFGYSFCNPDLLREALTHPSAGESFSNQRLEFLGDAVIDLVVAEHLFKEDSQSTEGKMTLTKAAIVNGTALALRAASMGLGDMIVVGPGLGTSDRWPDSVYSDALEAVVGAVYLDGGLTAATKFVLNVFSEDITKAVMEGTSKDYKSLLLEFAQAGSGQQPVYEVMNEDGPSHKRIFVVSVTIGDMHGEGKGKTKKEAEQNAAESLLRTASLI